MRQQTGASPDLILAYTNPLYVGNVTPYDSTSLTAWAKFAAMAEGARIASRELWGSAEP